MGTALQTSEETSGALVIPSELSFLAPCAVDDLIRVGRMQDGGYVLPEGLVRDTDMLISCGVSNEWSFDEHFARLRPGLIIHAYDHTISRGEFARSFQRALLKVSFGQTSLKDVRTRYKLLKAYETFFSANARHFEERIHNRMDRPNDTTLDKVFERTSSDKIFMKIDIEGSEYRIIDDILKYSHRITGLAIEFHDTDPLRQVFISSVRKLQEQFEVVHFHANNYAGVAEDRLPDMLELTFANKSRIQSKQKRSNLPLPQADFPCNPKLADYQIHFLF